MFIVELYDRLLFPVFKPVIAGNPAIVLIGLTIPFLPPVKLAREQSDPTN
jgi:hypothetical protein